MRVFDTEAHPNAQSIAERTAKIQELIDLEKSGKLPYDLMPAMEVLRERGLVDAKPDAPGMGEKLAVGLGRGATNIVQGATQALHGGLGSLREALPEPDPVFTEAAEKYSFTEPMGQPGQLEAFTADADRERALYGASPVGQSLTGKAGELAGEILPAVAMPLSALPLAGSIGQAATKLPILGKVLASTPAMAQAAAKAGTAGAIEGAAIEGLTGYVPEGGSRLDQMGTAMQWGAGLGAPLGLAADVVQRVARARAGAPVADAATERVFQEAADQGIPIYPADVLPGKAVNTLDDIQSASDFTPLLGAKTKRDIQLDAAQDAANRVSGELEAAVPGAPWRTGSYQSAPGALPASRRAAATRLQEDIANSDPADWAGQVALSSRASLLQRQLDSDANYADLAARAGATATRPQNTMAGLNAGLRELDSAVVGNPSLSSALTTIRDGIKTKGNLTYQELHGLRSDLGDMVSDYYTGQNSAIGAKGVQYLQQAKKNVEADMERLAGDIGGDFLEDYQRANAFHRANVVPFKAKGNPLMRIAASTDNTDELVTKLLAQRGAPDKDVRQFLGSLDDRGRAALQAGVFQRAVQHATDPDIGNFSPAKFAAFFNQRQGATGAMFPNGQVEGLKRVMAHVKNATKEGANPATGARLLAPALAAGAGMAGAYVSPLAAILSATGAVGLRTLFQNPTTARLLAAAGDMMPGDPRLDRLVRMIVTAVRQGQMQGDERAAVDQSQGRVAAARERLGFSPLPGARQAPAPAPAPQPTPTFDYGPNNEMLRFDPAAFQQFLQQR